MTISAFLFLPHKAYFPAAPLPGWDYIEPTRVKVRLESKLYDVKTEKPIWSSQSKTGVGYAHAQSISNEVVPRVSVSRLVLILRAGFLFTGRVVVGTQADVSGRVRVADRLFAEALVLMAYLPCRAGVLLF